MVKLRDLFEKEPDREIESVVKVTVHTPEIVRVELEEYVPTEEIKKSFRRIIEGFIETRRGYTEEVCVWLSGFFGSGKSHFLKVLGYLLENRELETPDGRTIQSTPYISAKLGLQNLAPLISKEFRTKVLFLYLLDYDPTVDPTLSRLIYRSLKEEKGFSDKIWVSLWEEELWKEGKYEAFKEWVREEFACDWEEKRKLHAEAILKKAIPKFLPLYSNEEDAGRAIEESKREEIRPSDIVKELRRYAEEIDESKGRIVVLLDEAGLYVGDSTERLTDLNALAEQVVKEGEGKVWLIATSQEALPEMVDRFAMERQKLEWLRDRFRHFSLTPAGVEEVVSERMLKKKVEAIEILREFYQNKAGVISDALSLKSAKLPGDINEEDFVRFYPFLPYSIRLLQDVSRALVRTLDDARRFSARERSMLKIVHAILSGEGDIDCFAEKEPGVFVTFDILYDAISSDLRFIRSDYHTIIEKDISELGEIEGVKVSSVAKALFLLQNVEEKVPCSLDNLSAVLFPDVSANKNRSREAVKKCLDELRADGWVIEENGAYRLLTYDEHYLEDEIRKNLPRVAEKRKFLKEELEEKLKKFEYRHGKSRRPFDVGFTIDGEKITEGNLKVVIYTSFSDKKEEEILRDSSDSANIVYWLSAQDSEFDRLVERTIALKKTEDQFRTLTLTEEQRQYIKILGEEYIGNKSDISRKIETVFQKGVIYVSGVKSAPLDSFEKTLEERLEPIAEEVYSEFVDARPKRDEECAEVLKWKPGVKIAEVYRDLGIVVNNTINVSAKVPSTVLKRIEYRRSRGLPRTGKDLMGDFDDPPYGWDTRVVRLAVASLFKAGKISVMWNNKEYYSATPELNDVFVKSTQFNRASFDVLPEVDWRKARELLSSIFGVRSDDTFEKTAEKVRDVAEVWRSDAKQSQTRAIDNELPERIRDEIGGFIKAIEEVIKIDEPNAKLRVFLEKEEDLRRSFNTVKSLKEFNFEKYREIKKFIENPVVGNALVDFSEKLEDIRKTILSEAIIDRISELEGDYNSLLDAFIRKYEERHKEFNKWIIDALEVVENHKAFELKPVEARDKEEELKKHQCENLVFEPGALYCKNCKRHFTDMHEDFVRRLRQKVLVELDKLIPGEIKPPEPLEIEEELRSEEIEGIIKKIREYFSKYKGIFEVKIKIKPGVK